MELVRASIYKFEFIYSFFMEEILNVSHALDRQNQDITTILN